MKLFSVYDLKAQVYAPPFVARNEQVAARMILEACEDRRIQLAKFPADYQLRVVADWDEDKGVTSDNTAFPLVVASVEEILRVAASSDVEEKVNE